MNGKKFRITAGLLAVVAMFAFGMQGCGDKEGNGQADPSGHDQSGSSGTAAAATVQTMCPVMESNPINKNIFVEYEGKKVYFCCPDCVEKFKADPAKYLDKLPQFKDAAKEAGEAVKEAEKTMTGMTDSMGTMVAEAIEQKTCPVMDGNPINTALFIEYEGKKVYFCCPGCEEKFKADPAKYVVNLPQFQKP
ncbi:MAG: YHS domain-containing protein [Sedimentisphaerales bacterium]|nr:YHS domain-containing protein [Sedimentisphaerales bacterium]